MNKFAKLGSGIIIVLLFLPGLLMIFGQIAPNYRVSQQILHPHLAGVVKEYHYPLLSVDSLISSKYQTNFNSWFNQKYGLREPLVRLNNQLYYSLFQKSYMSNGSVIIGKSGQLYEKAYINDYLGLGKPFSASNQLTVVQKIAKVQQAFQKRGIPFFVLITPSKAYTMPEYIPDNYQPNQGFQSCPYNSIRPSFDQYEIQYIDGQRIITDESKHSPHPLFCQGGTHWNTYGASLVVNPLLAKIEIISKHQTGRIIQSDVKLDQNPTGTDRDLADLLNLITPVDKYPTPHPVIQATYPSPCFKPSIVVIGDSFSYLPLEILSKNNLARQIDFYFYYRLNHFRYTPTSFSERPVDIETSDWSQTILNHDVVILEINNVLFSGKHVQLFLDDALKKLQ